jgi:hypothetical protein
MTHSVTHTTGGGGEGAIVNCQFLIDSPILLYFTSLLS